MSKKKIIMIIVLILFLTAIVAIIFAINNKAKQTIENNQVAEKSSEILEITDNYFIEQTNDIFYNTDDYIDKKIKIAGLIYTYKSYDTDKTYYAVVRNTPGCCGNDGLAGLDIRYDGEYPEKDAWVEIEGIIEKDTVDGEVIPAIQVTSLQETDEGTTFVTN